MQNRLYWHHLPFIALPQENFWIIGPSPKAKMLFHLEERETVQQSVREQKKILSQASRLETSYYDVIIKVNGIDEHTLINQQKHLLCLKCHLFCTALQLSIRNDEWLGLG